MRQNLIWRSHVEGPRFANFRRLLFAIAQLYGVDIEIEDQQKGIIRETIFFKYSGEQDKVELCQKQFVKSVNDYNNCEAKP